MAAVVLKKPDQAGLLEQLAQAVDLDQRGPEAKKLHAQIAASIWTAQDRERGRQMGRDANALKAHEARILWRKEAIRLIVDGYDAGIYVFRDSIVSGLHSFSFAYGLKGKGGGNVQLDTISKWFSKKIEADIRLEAIASLLARTPK